MTLRHLRVFLAVCKHGSMTQAAQELFLTQPSVSQTIRELEEYYNTKLFDRFPRRLMLTDAGELLRRSAENILYSLDEIESRIRLEETLGTVRLGANLSVGTVLIHRFMPYFRRLHPDTQLRLSVTRSSVLEKKLMDNELDLALMENSGREPDLVREPFYKDRIVVVARGDSPFAHVPGLTLRALKDQPFLLREKGAGGRDQFDHIALSQSLTIPPVWESSSTTALVNAVEAGLGIAVLPYLLVAHRIADGTLAELKLTDVQLERTLDIVHHRSKLLSAPARDLIQAVRDWASQEEGNDAVQPG